MLKKIENNNKITMTLSFALKITENIWSKVWYGKKLINKDMSVSTDPKSLCTLYI